LRPDPSRSEIHSLELINGLLAPHRQLPFPSHVCEELVQSLHTAPPRPHALSCVLPFGLQVPALQQPAQPAHVAAALHP